MERGNQLTGKFSVKGEEAGEGASNPPQFPSWQGRRWNPPFSAVEFKCQLLFIFPIKDPYTFYLG